LVVDEPVLPVAREGRAAESILLAQPEGEVVERNGALDRTYQ
jgi:hypothetical protein